MDKILLLIENTENSKLLLEFLSSHYEVFKGDEVSIIKDDFDLCIVDGISITKFEELILSKKMSEQPVFLPFLLVTSRKDIGMATRYLWRVIDELIILPIEKAELLARVNNLLQIRDLSLKFYRAVLNSSPIGIILLDQKGVVKAWSLSAERILGWKSDEVIEEPIYTVMAQNRNIITLLKKVLKGETITNTELSCRGIEGSEIEIEITISPVYNTDKSMLYILLMFSDITERKRLERENIKNLQVMTALYKELQKSYDATIESLGKALELRDKDTEGHTKRVAELTEALARKFGIEEEDIIHIRRGAILHDIGKLSIPDAILLKPGKLNEEEWNVIKKHPEFAYIVLSSIEYLRPALDIPYCHHEKWDGTGYPRGLKGEDIPLSARIFAVVDVWDALTSNRPYRPAWNKEETLRYIKEQAGKYFDPKVVEVFLEVISEYL